ncbi:DUF4105 domain-containing protein [Pseudoxanthomonas sacheonensis]|uniref:DUF7844 domain-containing protein n=1 Tax=Pseudoxanthomonas sacheonensis TaxID=443615 RepID=UPI001FE4C586|nr:DUF4105 domain-containing protein [Pseudoxanthomonas sacheonensis]
MSLPCGSAFGGAGRWLLLFALACAGNAQAGLRLQPETGPLTPEEAAATRQLLDSAVRRLPPAWVAALGSIPVIWRDDLPAQVHGRAKAKRLLLNRVLLDDWMARPAGAGIDEPATHAALSAVLHELAHFYDRTAQGRLSRAPRLLDLAGWQVSPLRLGLRTSRNAFGDRSPDPYELDRASEFVAVNLEYFLLDPDYACRRPALYRFFSEHFDWAPAHAGCAPGQVFLQADADSGESALLRLDPSRVYAVDYLLAEPNQQPMSRWGHSMLRLVICAPDRPPGPDCRLDLRYHRVLSFRAFVDDVQISSWRGLTGSYPSRLFLLPLEQVIDEYTKVELRGLQSIPLRLDPAEIAGLLERAAQTHWTYDGRYYFLGNNCAVETFKLLHDGVPRLAGEPLASITPTGLLRRLKKAGIADASVLDDPAEALRLGYRFESAGAHYQAMFDVARSGLGLPQQGVREWLELAPTQRAPWLERGDLRASAALLLLEEAALRQQELLVRDELKRRYLGHGAQQGGNAFDGEAALRDFLRVEGFLSHPAALLPNGSYGLPQTDERKTLELEGERYAAQRKRQSAALRVDARKWISPERRSTLERTETNIASLSERLQRLHKEQNGLQLQ